MSETVLTKTFSKLLAQSNASTHNLFAVMSLKFAVTSIACAHVCMVGIICSNKLFCCGVFGAVNYKMNPYLNANALNGLTCSPTLSVHMYFMVCPHTRIFCRVSSTLITIWFFCLNLAPTKQTPYSNFVSRTTSLNTPRQLHITHCEVAEKATLYSNYVSCTTSISTTEPTTKPTSYPTQQPHIMHCEV